MSILALPARKSITGADTNHLMLHLISDTSSFMLFSSFSSAVFCFTIERDLFAQRL